MHWPHVYNLWIHLLSTQCLRKGNAPVLSVPPGYIEPLLYLTKMTKLKLLAIPTISRLHVLAVGPMQQNCKKVLQLEFISL